MIGKTQNNFEKNNLLHDLSPYLASNYSTEA